MEPIKHIEDNEEYRYRCTDCGRITERDVWECRNCGNLEIEEVVYNKDLQVIVRVIGEED